MSEVRIDKNGHVLPSIKSVNFIPGQLLQGGNPVGRYSWRDIAGATGDDIDRLITGLTAGTAAQNLFSSINNTGAGTYVRSTTHFLHTLDLTCIPVYRSDAVSGAGALVSPRHLVCAHHATPPNGTTIRFVTATNAVVSRTISSCSQIGITDVEVCKLDSDVPNTITFAKVLRNENLIGAATIQVDQNQKLSIGDGLSVYDYVSPPGVELNVQTPAESNRAPYWHFGVTEDSGHPWFTVIDGRLALISTYYGNVDGPIIAHYWSAINAAMTSLGGGYQLTDVGVVNTPVLLTNYADRNGQPGDVPVLQSNRKLNANWMPSPFNATTAGALSTDDAGSGFFRITSEGIMQFDDYIGDFSFANANQRGRFRASTGAYFGRHVAKSANFSITSADAGTIFDVTTGSSNIVVTLDTAANLGTDAQNFECMIRKVDSGTGTITANSQKIGKLNHWIEVDSDGTTIRSKTIQGGFDSSGNFSLTGPGNITVTAGASGNVVLNGASIPPAGTIPTAWLGSTSTTAAAGNDSRLSDTRTPTDNTVSAAKLQSASVTYAKMQNVSATSRVLGRKTAGAGSPEELTLSDVLDSVGSATRGDILYRGASGWVRLPAGTDGYVLTTHGASADPTWGRKPRVENLEGGTNTTLGWSPVEGDIVQFYNDSGSTTVTVTVPGPADDFTVDPGHILVQVLAGDNTWVLLSDTAP